MLFDHCSVCKQCCHIEPGYPALEVTLTQSETSRLGSVCIDRRCQHLAPTGCELGADKPFGCTLYPLSYNPVARNFHYDTECPLMPEYIRQLGDPSSEARAHLKSVTATIRRLEKTDPAFLATNFEIDTDYFELKKLPASPRKRKTST